MEVISLVEASSFPREHGYSQVVSVEPMAPMKGQPKEPVKEVYVPDVFSYWNQDGPHPNVPLMTVLLQPGQKLILLAYGQDGTASIDGPCDAIPATPENLAIVNSALKQLSQPRADK